MSDDLTIIRRAALLCLFIVSSVASTAFANEFNRTWRDGTSAIVLDAYEHTPIDWLELPKNKRLTAFINKASDGLAPKYRCKGDEACRANWRRYSATKELYNTRRAIAITQGLKWGAYHLARPGNPVEQADHFLSFAKPGPDDLIALDIEHDDPRKWMSLEDGEIFARHIKKRTGRWPVLYTNHFTSKAIAARKDELPVLSRLNLWYARYKEDIRGVFPLGRWDSYAIWQFSSMVNCNDRTCPMRIKGTGNWIDVNVVAMSPEQLRAAWPLSKPVAGEPPAETTSVAAATKPGEEISLVRYSGGVPLLRTTFERPVQVAKLKVDHRLAIAAAKAQEPVTAADSKPVVQTTAVAKVDTVAVQLDLKAQTVVEVQKATEEAIKREAKPASTQTRTTASAKIPPSGPVEPTKKAAPDPRQIAENTNKPEAAIVAQNRYVAAYSQFHDVANPIDATTVALRTDDGEAIPPHRMNRDVTVPTTRELGLRTRYDDEDREYTPAEIVAWKRFLRRQAAIRAAQIGERKS
ncbi:MAG: GH25 family lysozyme [Pseudomonadota bacterium]